MKPTRPALRYHGGKWRLAPFLLQFFPAHRVYVEPFGGAASVLMRKARSYAEVYNDLDDEVVSLFRVLRDDEAASRLKALLTLTPFARTEFEDAAVASDDPVERARRLIIRAFMGFGSNAHASSCVAGKNGFRTYTSPDRETDATGFRAYSGPERQALVEGKVHLGRVTGFRANSSRSGTTPATDWRNYPDALEALVDRLRGVIIEHRDALRVMAQHDGTSTLHYVDPPYVHSTRAPSNRYDLKYRMYRHELTDAGHVALLEGLRGLSGMVVLSGYPCALYDEALADWASIETQALADGARKRTEVLWLNPACSAALARLKHSTAGGEDMPLLSGAAI